MENTFNKRIYTFRLFAKDLFFICKNTFNIIRLFRDKNARKLIDKTLLVVTGINNCKYCTWIDAKIAINDGIDKKEVLDILNQNFNASALEDELPALMYAQNFTETNRNTSPEIVQNLYNAYGKKKAEQIKLTVRVVTFGNMYFNTWLAVLSRLKGKPAPNSNIFFEIPYFICNSFKIVPLMIWRRLDKNVISI